MQFLRIGCQFLSWNYPEINGAGELWISCANAFDSEYEDSSALLGTKWEHPMNGRSTFLDYPYSRLSGTK